jgi:DNA-directed RNA polymerase specialized sigma24 family protein
MMSLPSSIETILAKPGATWSTAERKKVKVWLNTPPERDRWVRDARRAAWLPDKAPDDLWQDFQLAALDQTIDLFDSTRGQFAAFLGLRLRQFCRKQPVRPLDGWNARVELIEIEMVGQHARADGAAVDALDLQRLRPVLQAGLRELPKRYLDPIVMRIFDDKSDADIARELDITEENVRVLRWRGLRRLRAALADLGVRRLR